MILKQLPKTRYYLLGYDGCYPSGGMRDIIFGFETFKQCEDKIASSKFKKRECYEIVDNEERTVVYIIGDNNLNDYLRDNIK